MKGMVLASLALACAFAGNAAAQEAGAQADAAAAVSPEMQAALAQPNRFFDRRRDAFRHPAETLAFFRVEAGMTVIDYMPSTGWYARVLVPYLGGKGRYIGLNPAAVGDQDYRDAITVMQEVFRKRVLDNPPQGAPIASLTTDQLGAEWRGTVDRALIFREMHNLRASGILAEELQAIRAALKADGLLGIVQHRAKPDAPDAYADGSKGYLREADVIALVEEQGFELIARSEINANPLDTADHPQGVWERAPVWMTRRPDLRGQGESDRMTLLFRKRG